MRLNLAAYSHAQVFLNYPFDLEFAPLANAMHFAVVAAGLIPVCANDMSVPDRPRAEMLVETILNCSYSAHDLSKCKGEGKGNYARLNMPFEMGMALFHAFNTQRTGHRCAFFVADRDYQIAITDLLGFDPKFYKGDDDLLVGCVYDWLCRIKAAFNVRSTIEIKDKFAIFKKRLARVEGGRENGSATHDEAQEVMFAMCSECGWWEWRASKPLLSEFPLLPILWKGRQRNAQGLRRRRRGY
jgi:hypothetical protein